MQIFPKWSVAITLIALTVIFPQFARAENPAPDLESLDAYDTKFLKKVAGDDDYTRQYRLYKLARKKLHQRDQAAKNGMEYSQEERFRDRGEVRNRFRILLQGAGLEFSLGHTEAPMAQYLVGLIYIQDLDERQKGEELLTKAYSNAVRAKRASSDIFFTLEDMYINALIHPEYPTPAQISAKPNIDHVVKLLSEGLEKQAGKPMRLGLLACHGLLTDQQIKNFLGTLEEDAKSFPGSMIVLASMIENLDLLKDLRAQNVHIELYEKAAAMLSIYAKDRLAAIKKQSSSENNHSPQKNRTDSQ